LKRRKGGSLLPGVIDAYSRKRVGWAMGQNHDAELVKRALQMALIQRQPGVGLIHHSDRGSEYASKSHQKMLEEHDIQVNISRKGDCHDNALIESFWGTLKEEWLGRNTYATRKEAKNAVFYHIETCYNRKRKHSYVGYLSPGNYEHQMKGERGKNT
jgi:putative transposase